MFKRSLALLLCLTMLLSAWIIPAAAEGGNISMTVTGENLKVGDFITVSLSSADMMVATFGAVINFDTSKLECTEIKGAIEGEPNVVLINKQSKGSWDPPVIQCEELSTVDEANDKGVVSTGFPGTKDTQCLKTDDFLIVTFKVIATGESTILLKEKSSGTNGYTGEVGTETVTVAAATLPAPKFTLSVKRGSGSGSSPVDVDPCLFTGEQQTWVEAMFTSGYSTEYTIKWERQKDEGAWESVTPGDDGTWCQLNLTDPGEYTYRMTASYTQGGVQSPEYSQDITLNVDQAVEMTGVTIKQEPTTAYAGQSVTLNAVAGFSEHTCSGGTCSLSYQWYAGSDEIDGATSNTYTISDADVGSNDYKVVVNHTQKHSMDTSVTYTSTKEATHTLTINELPQPNIKNLTPSTATTVYYVNDIPRDGEPVLEVTAKEPDGMTGGTLSYQWLSRKSGTDAWTEIAGATDPQLTLTESIQTLHNNSAYDYKVTVTYTKDGATSSVDSEPRTIAVVNDNGPYVWEQEGHTHTVAQNGTLTLNADFTPSNASESDYVTVDYTFEWEKKIGDTWSPITADEWDKIYVPTGTAGTLTYRVRTKAAVTPKDGIGGTPKNLYSDWYDVTVDVIPAPTFTTDLPTEPQIYFFGDDLPSFTVAAEAPAGMTGGTLSYQWYTRIKGATEWGVIGTNEATLAANDLSTSVGEQEYKVRATYTKEGVSTESFSQIATIVILPQVAAPEITMDASVTVWQSGSLQLQPTVSDKPANSDYAKGYQNYTWYVKSGDSWNEVNNLGYKDYNTVPTGNAGEKTYKIVVENKLIATGAKVSTATAEKEITVTIVEKAKTPTVTVDASKTSAVLNEDVTLTATVTNETNCVALTYQWYENDAPMDGKTGSTLTVTSANAVTKQYYVKVTNTKTHPGLADNTATKESDKVTVTFAVDPKIAEVINKLDAITEINAVPYMATDGEVQLLVINAAKPEIHSVDGMDYTGYNPDSVTHTGKKTENERLSVTVNFRSAGGQQSHKLKNVKINRLPNPSIALVDATLAKLKLFTNIQQNGNYPTEADAIAQALAQARVDMNVDTGVKLTDVTYTAPVAGTYAAPNGTNGQLTFKVSYTATAPEGDPYTGTSGPQNLVISADPLTAQERIDAAMAALDGVLNGITLAQTNAGDYVTQSVVTTALQEKIQAGLQQYGVGVSVYVSNFTAPQPGSAATSREGKNGEVKYTVTLSYEGVSQTSAEKTATITALRYVGLLDREAVQGAEKALNGMNNSELSVPFGSTEDQIKQAAYEAISQKLQNLQVEVEGVGTYPAEVTFVLDEANATVEKTGDKVTAVTVPVTVSKDGTASAQNPISVKLTVVEGVNPSETLADAVLAALKSLTYADVALKDYPDRGAVETKIITDAKAKLTGVENADKVTFTVTVEDGKYVQAANGTAAEPAAKNGSITFVLSFTANNSIQPVTKSLAEMSFAITAKDFDGLSDQQAVQIAEEAFEDLTTLGKLDQTKAATEADAKTAIETALKAAIEEKAGSKTVDWNTFTLTVNVSEFTAAEAGSAATSKAGKNGSFKVTFSAQQGQQSYTPAEAVITITATPFTGVLDTEAVAAAKSALTGQIVTVPIRSTEQERLDKVQTFVNGKLTGNAAGVTAALAKSGDNAYTVTLTKAGATDSVTVTWKEADPIKLAAPANVVFEQGVAEWDAVDHAVSYRVTLFADSTTGEMLGTFETTDLLYDLSAELEKGHSYVVTVMAIADGVFYVNSDATSSEVYAIRNDNMYDNLWFWVLLKQYSQVYPVSATAGEGGSISPAGITDVNYKKNLTYTITPDEGYAIAALYIDGVEQAPAETYTFKQVKGAHTIRAEFVKLGWNGPFADVEPMADYAEAVRFVYENGYVDGISETEFAPEAAMSRADLVTALGRMIGVDTTYYMGSKYADVAADAAYAPYTAWAAEAKLLAPKADGSFGVEDALTVEELAVVLAAFADYAGLSTVTEATLEGYTDAATVADTARAAMQWLVGSGIYAGENGALAPQTDASRAQTAEMLAQLSVLLG